MVRLARRAVETGFDPHPAPPAELIASCVDEEDYGALTEPGAVFVTVKDRDGKLRGCIGSLWPRRPLANDVVHNARSAARDPRLPPVEAGELGDLRISVSVLSPLKPSGAESFGELVPMLRPGVDGVLLSSDGRRSTFLPSVWGNLPDPAHFVRALLEKGGWERPEGMVPERWPWPEGLVAELYTAESFAEPA